jgi:hypothetical protein
MVRDAESGAARPQASIWKALLREAMLRDAKPATAC